MQGVGSPQTPGSAPAAPRTGTPGRSPARTDINQPRPRHSFWWYVKWFFITIQLILFCLIVVTVCIGKGIYDELSQIVPDTHYITLRNKVEATRVYAADGTLLAEFKGDERDWVSINQLMVQRKRGTVVRKEACRLVDATLSVEDARFYTHPGMDAKRIVGAALANYRSGGTSQGGSTITEQLAVNLYLKRKKTFSRRLQTALLALQLERRFSKDEILELYLNEIFYGNHATGCEAASHLYFNKPARNLSIAQAALLAGLPQQPKRLEPFYHFDNAKKRQAIVLHEMFQNKKINWGQYQQALKDTSVESDIARAKVRYLNQHRQKPHWLAPYFVAYVKQYLQRQYDWTDDYLNTAGLKIYTTLDTKMQANAEMLLKEHVGWYSQRSAYLQGALVCIDPNTGHLLAMVGGRDYYDDAHNGRFNRAAQARRQVGSSFKPYVYATALEMGYSPDSRVVDRPLRVNGDREVKSGGHEIKNFTFRHDGNISFRQAIAQSNNVAAVRVLLKVGIQNVIQKAHLMGIQSSLVPVPTLALGTSELTPVEHTSAFGVFATRGLRAESTPVERVDNAVGETIMEHSHPVRGARVLSPEAANGMWDMLRGVVTEGTGKNAQIGGVDVIGKTGTTSSNKDIWFMGATKDLVCGVWMGYDRPRDLGGNSAGGKWCAPLWRDFMVRALDIWSHRNPIQKVVEDARATAMRQMVAAQFKKYVQVRICNESGLRATSACPSTRIEQFSSAGGATGGAPTQYCNIHVPRAHGSRSLGDTYDSSSSPQPGDLGYDSSTDQAVGIRHPARHDTGDNTYPEDTSDTRQRGQEPTVQDDQSTGNNEKLDLPDNQNDHPTTDENSDGQRQGSLERHTNVAYHFGKTARAKPKDEVTASTGDEEVVATVCAETGELATSHCPVTVQRFFAVADVPRRHCTLHTKNR